MDTPNKFMEAAHASISAKRDQAWSGIEESYREIKRIATLGPTAEDELLICDMARLLRDEIRWRQSERDRMEQGIIPE